MSKRRLALNIVLAVVSVLFIVGAALFLSACAHKHSYSDWQVVTEAGCETEGLEKRTCDCGQEETRKINPTGHDYGAWQFDVQAKKHTRTCQNDPLHKQTESCQFDEQIQEEATCEEEGVKILTCKVCQGSYTEVIEPLGHQHSDQAVDNKDGTHSFFCIRCQHTVVKECYGDEYTFVSDDQHHFVCVECGSENTEGCSVERTVVPAECEVAGKTIIECTLCHNKTEQEIPALEHKYGPPIFDIKTHSHKQICEHNSEHELVTPCQFDETRQEATCDDDGYVRHICRVCNGEYDEVLSATGHAYGQWQQGEGNTHYRVCGNNPQHKETKECQFEDVIKDSTCTSVGTKTSTCKDCQRVVITQIDKKDHVFDGWQHVKGQEQNKHQRTCEVCQTVEEDNCHFEKGETVDPKCLEQGYTVYFCTECGFDYNDDFKEELGHDYGEWEYDETEHFHTCQRDGCDAEERNGHTLNSQKTDPTCTQEGWYDDSCQICQYVGRRTIEANGHTWGEWTITDEGHSRECTVPDCDGREQGAHTYKDSNLCDACQRDGLKYETDGSVYVVAGLGDATEAKHIIIPAKHDNKVVDGIKKYAFNGCKNIESLKLEYGVRFIGESAFQSCSNLASVELPDSLKEIDFCAFILCSKLSKLNLPDSIETIGRRIISGTALENDPANWEDGKVFYIGKFLFEARNLEGTYEIREGTVYVEEYAFYGNTNLAKIVLPGSLHTVGSEAFGNCPNLKAVQYKGSVEGWFNIRFLSHASNPLHLSDDCTLHIDQAEGKITIPADKDITFIPAGTFRGDTGLQQIVIPSTVLSIGTGAFDGCTGLTSVIIPSSVKEIHKNAFRNCSALASVTIEGTVRIEAGAFDGTKLVKDFLDGQEEVLYLGSNLLKAKSSIANCTLKEGIYTIAAEAFKDCKNLVSIKMSAELNYIGASAFEGCSALQNADFSLNTKNWWAEFIPPSSSAHVFKSVGPKDMANQSSIVHYLTNWYLGFWER